MPRMINGGKADSYGFPLGFYGWVESQSANVYSAHLAGFRLTPFLLDLLLALAVAWLLALAADRVIGH